MMNKQRGGQWGDNGGITEVSQSLITSEIFHFTLFGAAAAVRHIQIRLPSVFSTNNHEIRFHSGIYQKLSG